MKFTEFGGKNKKQKHVHFTHFTSQCAPRTSRPLENIIKINSYSLVYERKKLVYID